MGSRVLTRGSYVLLAKKGCDRSKLGPKILASNLINRMFRQIPGDLSARCVTQVQLVGRLHHSVTPENELKCLANRCSKIQCVCVCGGGGSAVSNQKRDCVFLRAWCNRSECVFVFVSALLPKGRGVWQQCLCLTPPPPLNRFGPRAGPEVGSQGRAHAGCHGGLWCRNANLVEPRSGRGLVQFDQLTTVGATKAHCTFFHSHQQSPLRLWRSRLVWEGGTLGSCIGKYAEGSKRSLKLLVSVNVSDEN